MDDEQRKLRDEHYKLFIKEETAWKGMYDMYIEGEFIKRELKEILYMIGKLMQSILTPVDIHRIIITHDDKTIICHIGLVHPLFDFDVSLITRTPALFDFNTVYGVIDSIEKDLLQKHDVLEEHINSLRDNTAVFNNIIMGFPTD